MSGEVNETESYNTNIAACYSTVCDINIISTTDQIAILIQL